LMSCYTSLDALCVLLRWNLPGALSQIDREEPLFQRARDSAVTSITNWLILKHRGLVQSFVRQSRVEVIKHR
jgi:hypothetical protein